MWGPTCAQPQKNYCRMGALQGLAPMVWPLLQFARWFSFINASNRIAPDCQAQEATSLFTRTGPLRCPHAHSEIAVWSAHIEIDNDRDPLCVDDKVQTPIWVELPCLVDRLCCLHTERQKISLQVRWILVPIVSSAIFTEHLICQESTWRVPNHVDGRRLRRLAPNDHLLQDCTRGCLEVEPQQKRNL